eukprot:CFRG5106T1
MSLTELDALLGNTEGHLVHIRRRDFSLLEEIREILSLSSGVFVCTSSYMIIKSTDSALVGHVSTETLSAVTLSDLWTLCTLFLAKGSVLSIFIGQAIGAKNNRLAGIWFQVSLFVVSILCVIIMVLWVLTGPILRVFTTESDQIIDKASYYSCVIALSLPPKLLADQLTKFFTAQGIVKAPAIAYVFTCILNLVLGLVLVLGVGVEGWGGLGFMICPWVTVIAEYAMAFVFVVVFCMILRLHSACWYGWEPREVTWTRIKSFLYIFIPATLSLASDFWRISVLGVFASWIGTNDLAAFNITYRVLWLMFASMLALGVGVGVRLSVAMGAGNVSGGLYSIKVGCLLALFIIVIAVSVIGIFISEIGLVFSSDPAVISLLVEIRVPVCLLMLFMNISFILERIVLSACRVRVNLLLAFVSSWCIQVPGSYLAITYWRRDLSSLFYASALGYACLTSMLIVVVLKMDWNKISRDAIRRSEGFDRL